MADGTTDDTIDIDMTSAMQDMSDTFGGADGDEAGTGIGQTPAAEPSVPSTPPGQVPSAVALPAPGQTPPATEPWRNLPSSWKKEHAPHWEKFDPAIQQYVYQREQQFIDGVAQYKKVAEPYALLEKTYEPWLKHYNIPLAQATERLINSHLALLQAPPETKEKYVQSLIKDYQLEPLLRKMYGAPSADGGQPQPGAIPSELAERFQQYEGNLQQMAARLRAYEEADQQKALESSQSAVDAFVSDPQNEFAGEVLQDMVDLVKSGLATDLKSAYERAIWLNPTVKAKLLQREIEKAAKPSVPAPRKVRSGETPPASTKPGDESIDDTMQRVLSDINSRSA